MRCYFINFVPFEKITQNMLTELAHVFLIIFYDDMKHVSTKCQLKK